MQHALYLVFFVLFLLVFFFFLFPINDKPSAKAAETVELLEAGNSATSTNNMIKGHERTNAALEKWRAEQIGYENAKDAHQAYKAIMKILNDDIQRDYEQEKRTT